MQTDSVENIQLVIGRDDLKTVLNEVMVDIIASLNLDRTSNSPEVPLEDNPSSCQTPGGLSASPLIGPPFSLKEVAKLFKMSRSTLWRRVQEGKLEKVYLENSNRVFFSRRSVLALALEMNVQIPVSVNHE